ncbi:4-(cytidine 5'-diphospho)-2-C-methyl-D-erythritol kinase [Rhabdochromatium marinum]|uniref:4-(cytidine 5'-diphospho)-2-C-methyl-D-erythritol kinase n=1 Tax=Rhabdochromatium marinum TaxID=48729 RepID=UPI00190546AE|nr:4-(cytidine 5'-diphospho)-2-C-methyl-D-erythritol kinase [Rhabdochromatium marinum]MBK1648081.1 4-(cytidine 5'-diphospho)-2-C-methyl-D-erythritol kinase [Rhabdochromatium marinum]
MTFGLHPAPAADGAWLAPAKLNLTLRVLGRRADGYHQLQSVFQFLDYCDRLFIEPQDDGRIRRLSGAPEVPEEQDLVVRAARLLQRHTGCPRGAEIRVEKHLPLGGGLGGGSSDAATTLHALNQLWALGLDVDQLAALGLELGADVPVFVRAQAAWAEGVGEQLEPVELPEPWYLVLVPPCQVSTAAVFADPDLTRDSPPIKIAGFVEGDDRNDCLAVVLGRYQPVAEAFEWLAARAKARLTGTGACLFAACADRSQAEQLRAAAPSLWSPFIAQGCNCSPLMRNV